jgi:hypothetical protein
MSKRERQRKHSISIAIAAVLLAACPSAFATTGDKATPGQTRLELTAATQSLGGEEPVKTKATGKAALKPTAPLSVKTAGKPAASTSKSANTATKPTESGSVKATTSSTSKTSTIAPKPAKASDAASQRYAELNKDSGKTDPKDSPKTAVKKASEPVKKKTKSRTSTTMLVPPPPPTIPTYLNVPENSAFNLGGFGISIPAMSLDDLKFQQKNVEKKLESAKIDEKDQKRITDEKLERATRFVSLFEEGVVSRRELENAKEESERSVRKLEQTHINVAESDRLLSQIKERIHSLEAAKRPIKISSKTSRKSKKQK